MSQSQADSSEYNCKGTEDALSTYLTTFHTVCICCILGHTWRTAYLNWRPLLNKKKPQLWAKIDYILSDFHLVHSNANYVFGLSYLLLSFSSRFLWTHCFNWFRHRTSNCNIPRGCWVRKKNLKFWIIFCFLVNWNILRCFQKNISLLL